jgi:hypothetical protein
MSVIGTNAKCRRVCDVSVLGVTADSQQATVGNIESAICALVDSAPLILVTTNIDGI